MADIFATNGKGGLYDVDKEQLKKAHEKHREKRESAGLSYDEGTITFLGHVLFAYEDLWKQDVIDHENRFILSAERFSMLHGWGYKNSGLFSNATN